MKRFAFTVACLLLLLQPAFAQSTIFLVRHAEKSTSGDGKDPDLSDAGHARAKALAAILKDARIAAIYVTEFKRTQQTAEPLAAAAGIKPTIVPGKDTADLVKKLKAESGDSLVVGHSNTIPEILKALGIAEPPPIGDSDYDNLFILTPGAPARLMQLHFR